MRYLSIICLSLTCFTYNQSVNAQGESDPGFSTIGALRPASALPFNAENDEYEYQRTHIGFGDVFARGERNIEYNSPQLEVRVPLEDYGYFDVKVPIVTATGELARAWGVGDMVFAYTHMFVNPNYEDWTFQLTGGSVIGFSNADQQDGKARSLPMAYQSGLGSTDVVVGANVKWKDYITVALGYQQPVFRYNDNDYDRLFKVNDLAYNNTEYEVARKLYRNGDMMLRVEGSYSVKRGGISLSPLLIYHLANDLYTDRAGLLREIKGSEGLTVSLVGNAYARFGRRSQFKLDVTGSLPFVTRDATPDGLSREWYIMPRFSYFFNQRSLQFRYY
jgi:hypothetical protein